MSTHKHYARAALFALTGFTGWTLSDTLLKVVRSGGIPTGEVLLISGISGMLVIFLLAALRGKIGNLKPKKWRGLFILGLCQCTASVFWLAALPRLPLTNLYIVAFMTPMAVAGLAALVLKEHLGWKRGLAIALGFVGVIVAVNPVGLLTDRGERLAYFLVGGNMLSTAVQMLLLRVVSQRETSECTSFYPRMMFIVYGVLTFGVGGFVALSPAVFLAIAGSGALGGLGWAMMSQAYKNAPAAAVAPFQYSQMISGAVAGYLIWGDVPDAWLTAGTAIIIASGVYLVRHERRASRTMMRVD